MSYVGENVGYLGTNGPRVDSGTATARSMNHDDKLQELGLSIEWVLANLERGSNPMATRELSMTQSLSDGIDMYPEDFRELRSLVDTGYAFSMMADAARYNDQRDFTRTQQTLSTAVRDAKEADPEILKVLSILRDKAGSATSETRLTGRRKYDETGIQRVDKEDFRQSLKDAVDSIEERYGVKPDVLAGRYREVVRYRLQDALDSVNFVYERDFRVGESPTDEYPSGETREHVPVVEAGDVKDPTFDWEGLNGENYPVLSDVGEIARYRDGQHVKGVRYRDSDGSEFLWEFVGANGELHLIGYNPSSSVSA